MAAPAISVMARFLHVDFSLWQAEKHPRGPHGHWATVAELGSDTGKSSSPTVSGENWWQVGDLSLHADASGRINSAPEGFTHLIDRPMAQVRAVATRSGVASDAIHPITTQATSRQRLGDFRNMQADLNRPWLASQGGDPIDQVSREADHLLSGADPAAQMVAREAVHRHIEKLRGHLPATERDIAHAWEHALTAPARVAEYAMLPRLSLENRHGIERPDRLVGRAPTVSLHAMKQITPPGDATMMLATLQRMWRGGNGSRGAFLAIATSLSSRMRKSLHYLHQLAGHFGVAPEAMKKSLRGATGRNEVVGRVATLIADSFTQRHAAGHNIAVAAAVPVVQDETPEAFASTLQRLAAAHATVVNAARHHQRMLRDMAAAGVGDPGAEQSHAHARTVLRERADQIEDTMSSLLHRAFSSSRMGRSGVVELARHLGLNAARMPADTLRSRLYGRLTAERWRHHSVRTGRPVRGGGRAGSSSSQDTLAGFSFFPNSFS